MSSNETAGLVPTQIHHLLLTQIHPDPDQPRREFPEPELKALAASLSESGVLQPITVRPNGDGYVIKIGERRWRAAGLAKLKTIPALIDEREQTLIERGLDQIAENEFRQPLNVMEQAEFLVRLRDVERKSANEIAKIMSDHGMKDAGRAAITNLMRLVELPDWSKQKVRSGELTAAHGKHLLHAPNFPAVQEKIKQGIDNDLRWRGKVTAEEMGTIVRDAMEEVGIRLEPDNYAVQYRHAEQPKFDIGVCKGCEFFRNLNGTKLCFSQEGFDKKQAEAIELLKSNPASAPKGARDAEAARLREEARAEAEASRERRKAMDAGIERRVTDYFHEKLRAHLVLKVLPELADRALNLQLTFFLAMDMPTEHRHAYVESDAVDETMRAERDRATVIARSVNLAHFLAGDIDDAELLLAAQACVKAMSHDMLRQLAHHLKVKADPLFRIDEAYLALLRRPQLEALCKKAKFSTIAGLTGKSIKAKLLADGVEVIRVPADLQKTFDAKPEVVKRPLEKEINEAREDFFNLGAAAGGEADED